MLIDKMRQAGNGLIVKPTREQSVAPICVSCEEGFHEQFLLAYESCSCPCHGTCIQHVGFKLAA